MFYRMKNDRNQKSKRRSRFFFQRFLSFSFAWFALIFVISFLSACQQTQKEFTKNNGQKVSVKDEGVEMTVETSSDSIQTSDVLEWSVKVKYRSDYKVSLWSIPDRFGSFTVVDRKVFPPSLDEKGWIHIQSVYTLEPDEPGNFELPAWWVDVEKNDGTRHRLTGKTMKVTVLSVLPGGGDKKKIEHVDIRDIAPDNRQQTSETLPRWVVAVCLVNVVVVVLMLLLWKHWKKRKQGEEDFIWKAFLELETAPADQKKAEMESVLSKAIALHYGQVLKKCDFDGLKSCLTDAGIDFHDIVEIMDRWHHLLYAERDLREDEIHDCYRVFKEKLTPLWCEPSARKEVKS